MSCFAPLAPLLLLLTLPAVSPGDTPEELARSVTIHRDTYGVPHIYGPTDASVVFGLMYAQAEDNFWQLEEDYISSLGRSAEIYGSGSIGRDVVVRSFEPWRLAREEYARAADSTRALCDAFAAGVNYYLERNPHVRPRLLTRFEPWYILARHYAGASGRMDFNSLGITLPAMNLPPGTVLRIDGLPRSFEQSAAAEEGSNMWAVAPGRTVAGRAMLFINPHVAFFGGGQRYEAHLESEEGLHVSGFAMLGTPYIRSGRNRDVGWSHTDSGGDVGDVYIERFDHPSNPLAYRYGDGYRMAEEWIEDIAVANGNRRDTVRFRLRKTHRGPAFRIAGGYWLALRGADTGRFGNIFYLNGNAIPKRSTMLDRTGPVDGNDPETGWQGFHATEDFPPGRGDPGTD